VSAALPILGDHEQSTIRDAFAPLERDVAVTLELGPSAAPVTLLAAGGRELDTNAATRAIVEAVCALGRLQQAGTTSAGDRPRDSHEGIVRLAVLEHEEAGPWPRTTIAGPTGVGLLYLGMPAGYELATLVGAIIEAGRAEPGLSVATLDRVTELDRDVAIDVFVTPT